MGYKTYSNLRRDWGFYYSLLAGYFYFIFVYSLFISEGRDTVHFVPLFLYFFKDEESMPELARYVTFLNHESSDSSLLDSMEN